MNYWRVIVSLRHLLLRLLLPATIFAQVLGMEQRLDGLHVFPGENIQTALDTAAMNPTNKVVNVHPGTYRPASKRPALIWFNRTHDGVRLEALGEVTLTAANPLLSRPSSASYPAVVNHVVYFGHGISSNTILRGFRITGANSYLTDKFVSEMEPDTTVPKNSFFLTDGGAIKVFGKSAPLIDQVEIVDNYSSPCGGGVSVQQQGQRTDPVIFQNCIFRRNRAQATGAALDLLEGSSARVINCLFTGNVSNTGPDTVARRSGEKPFVNSGAITIFQHSAALLRHCTFTGNRNAVDDLGHESTYENCIFFRDQLDGGMIPAPRYELDLRDGAVVRNCLFNGDLLDPRKSISPSDNILQAPDPQFDSDFLPHASAYKDAGYRPVRLSEIK